MYLTGMFTVSLTRGMVQQNTANIYLSKCDELNAHFKIVKWISILNKYSKEFLNYFRVEGEVVIQYSRAGFIQSLKHFRKKSWLLVEIFTWFRNHPDFSTYSWFPLFFSSCS